MNGNIGMRSLKRLTTILVVVLLTHVASAGNLIRNDGLEEIDPQSNFPTYWGVNPAYSGTCDVVTDALIAHQGSRCLSIGGDSNKNSIAVCAGGSPIAGEKQLTASIWAKGTGTLVFYWYLYAPNKFLSSVVSEEFKINRPEWKQYSATITIPEKAGNPAMPVEHATLAVHVVKGPVWIDDVSMYGKGKEPATENRDVQEGPCPSIAIPKTKTAPVIDGVLSDGEWERAVETTGFHMLAGKLAPRQTGVYATYDDTNLYVAFSAPITGAYDDGRNGISKAEAIEIWLMPPGRGWYQFYGTPSGNFLMNSEKSGQTWKAAWQYKSRVEDIKEIVGGIQTFDKKLWFAEISIPFKELGTACPSNGENWRVNFCRDFTGRDGRDRIDEDWTSWSQIRGGFSNSAMFGFAEFWSDAPAIQIKGLGDLETGNVSVTGRITGTDASEVAVEAVVTTREVPAHTISRQAGRVVVSPGKTARFEVGDDIKIGGKTELLLDCRFQEAGTGRLLSRVKLPFTCNTSFVIKPLAIYSRKQLFVEVDAGRVGGLPEEYRVQIEIPGTPLVKSQALNSKENKVCLEFDLSAVKTGDYLVKGTLLDGQDKVLASTSEPLPLPEKPVWLGNQIGVSEEVPPPWKPIVVNRKRVTVAQRQYCLEDNGLPGTIEVLGADLLAAPAVISARAGGTDLAWEFAGLKVSKQTAREVVFDLNGKAQGRDLYLKGTLRVEFDGFALLSFTLNSPEHLTLDALALEFPLKKEFCRYARGVTGLPSGKMFSASLYPNTFASAKDVDIGDWHTWYYSPRWKWDNVFLNEIWIGDGKKGLAVMCETDQFVRGDKQTEIIQEGATTRLKINLISKPCVLNQSLHYEYAYEATPVKPEPDPKHWHATFFLNWPDEYLKRLYVAGQYHLLKPINYTVMRCPEADGPRIKHAQTFGARVVTDNYMSAAQTETPEYKLYGPEWKVMPESGWSTLDGIARITCHRSTNPDFFLYAVKRWVEEFGFDGAYVDVSTTSTCANQYHGCGYVDEQGKYRPVFPQWATREFYKRFYTYLHTGGRDGVVFAHTMCQTAIAGFLDVVTEGEEWGTEKEQQYRRLSPDMFQAKDMKNQWGTPYTFYSFHQYSWRGNAYGEPVSFNEILMMCLPHRLLPTILDNIGGQSVGPIWDLMDPWWTTSDFIPYWSNGSPVRSSLPETVLASVYLKRSEKKALLVVSNWDYADVNADLTFDWKRLGLKPRAVIKDALTGGAITLDGNKLTCPISKRNLNIFLIE